MLRCDENDLPVCNAYGRERPLDDRPERKTNGINIGSQAHQDGEEAKWRHRHQALAVLGDTLGGQCPGGQESTSLACLLACLLA